MGQHDDDDDTVEYCLLDWFEGDIEGEDDDFLGGLKLELEDSISGVTLGGIIGLNFSDTAGLFVAASAWKGPNGSEDGFMVAAET